MDCIATMLSGNYVFHLCRILEKQGYVFEVASTPCQIAKEGCGYCLKFPAEYTDLVVGTGKQNGLPIREIYKIVPMFNKNRYERIY